MKITIELPEKWVKALVINEKINRLKKRVKEIEKRMNQIEGKEIEKEWLKKNCKQA